ncbi:AraC family transcriptional regulator [Aldersonia sp. NBC_00410]|uniref:AraC family transcriptional regulator n=1 Tax=Aldersonia sp. NBC_00410 TaxID=2975954 RepID=UPI00225BDF31|nr:AraC family transcriptional regulator [Aldersonia sp. NBC_00410]MCX5041898.1 AraC family transcriptional regulator [Aldersonia sp. NBC_00410]
MASDLVTATLQDFGMSGVFYAASEAFAPWGIEMPPMPGTLIFHLLTEGSAVVLVDGEERRIGPGEVVLVPHGTGHLLLDNVDSPATPLFDLPREELTDRYERIRIDGSGARSSLICGAVAFSGLAVARLVQALPPVLVTTGADAEWQRAALELIAAESRNPRPGSEVVTARLADVLVVQAIRSWLETEPPQRGWVAAVRDPDIGRALAALHARPAQPWTLQSLAAEAGMSRSAFAGRFATLLGEPVMSYVTSWRMDLAARFVREGGLPLARVAERVGYRSEAAFNRAFRRAHGCTPGVFARRGSGFLDRVDVPNAYS